MRWHPKMPGHPSTTDTFASRRRSFDQVTSSERPLFRTLLRERELLRAPRFLRAQICAACRQSRCSQSARWNYVATCKLAATVRRHVRYRGGLDEGFDGRRKIRSDTLAEIVHCRRTRRRLRPDRGRGRGRPVMQLVCKDNPVARCNRLHLVVTIGIKREQGQTLRAPLGTAEFFFPRW
jgi:hypothetical protein